MAWNIKDLGSLADVQFGGQADVTAAGAGDATEVNGTAIDNSSSTYGCCLAIVSYTTTLTQSETMTIAADIDEDDNSSFTSATATTLQTATTEATGDTGGSTETGNVKFVIDLTDKEEYVRVNFTPDLSAGATDTARLQLVYVLFPRRDTGLLTAADASI